MRRRPTGHRVQATAWPRSKAGKRSILQVKVRCRFCGQVNGPLLLDGKPYICKACRQSLFAYQGPSFDELMERVMAVPNPDRAMLARLEALAKGDLTQLEGLALREADA